MSIGALEIPLDIVCFGGKDVEFSNEISQAVAAADLILALGDIDLSRIASLIGPSKPALCVLGDYDPRQLPPPPLTPLHGNGVAFKGWRLVGLSGGIANVSEGPGFTLSDAEAEAILSKTSPTDILISHVPPSGLVAEIGPEPGLDALANYIDRVRPLYHFHTATIGESTTICDRTLVVGVDGVLIMPSIDLGL